MKCEICGREVSGDLGVEEEDIGIGFIISIIETSPRDWIMCDSCSKIVCHYCCDYPRSGYCDTCIDKYNLYHYLVEIGLIRE